MFYLNLERAKNESALFEKLPVLLELKTSLLFCLGALGYMIQAKHANPVESCNTQLQFEVSSSRSLNTVAVHNLSRLFDAHSLHLDGGSLFLRRFSDDRSARLDAGLNHDFLCH